MNDRDLMGMAADTGYTYDARGRMLRTNEPREAERRPAPRLVLGRTAAGNVIRVSAAVPEALAYRLEAILAHEPPAGDLRAPPAALAAVRQVLTQHAPITAEGAGPTYLFPESVAPTGEAVQITAANRALARDTYPWLYDEWADWQPCFAVVRDGAAVSVCFSSRVGPAAAEAGVDTLPAFRGRGFASAVTAAWAASLRKAGRIPLYSTNWKNLASQGVAWHLGLIVFGATWSWT